MQWTVPPIFTKRAQACDTVCGKWPKILPSFSTATAFLSWKLPGSCTHTQLFHQLLLRKCPCIRGCQLMQIAFWYCVTALAVLHMWNFSQTKIYIGFKSSCGSHSRKLNLLKIYPTKYFSHKNFRIYSTLYWLVVGIEWSRVHCKTYTSSWKKSMLMCVETIKFSMKW